MTAICSRIGAQFTQLFSWMYCCCFQPVSYITSSLPPLMMPIFTGSWKKTWLFSGFVLPGTNARSGMKPPAGTSLNVQLSTSQTEYCVPCALATGAAGTTGTETRLSNPRIGRMRISLGKRTTLHLCIVVESVFMDPRCASPSDGQARRHLHDWCPSRLLYILLLVPCASTPGRHRRDRQLGTYSPGQRTAPTRRRICPPCWLIGNASSNAS